MDSKPWYLSKTFWTNLILGVLIFVVPQEWKEYFTEANVAQLFAVVNIILRFFTDQQISLLKK